MMSLYPSILLYPRQLCSQMAYYSQPDGYGKGQGESALSLIETLFDALSTNKGLSKNNKRLDSDLGALSALVSRVE